MTTYDDPVEPGALRVGCSGWLYRHWRGDFYPKGLRQKDELGFYAGVFDTAEINASFYRMPAEGAVEGWRERTPEGFLYAWKASRYITHQKRLREPAEPVAFLFRRAALLRPKLGPILWQLPPGLPLDLPRLEAFLPVLPKGYRHAFEFRHGSWYTDATYALLAAYDAALVLSDHHHAPAPWVATASWVYVRGHGPGGHYRGDYPDDTLAQWAQQIRTWRSQEKPVFVYFDNDIGGAAPRDAQRLKRLFNR
jgi:uncharacterized protein YecE (DUF72 family)